MSVIDLMIDLRDRGIQLEADGDRLRYSPKAAMTPELAERVKAHKPELLTILTADDVRAAALWQAALDLLEDDPEFPPETLAACRKASVRWEGAHPTEDRIIPTTEAAIDPDLVSCDRCGSTDYRDVPVHNGQSSRRDCAQCHRFLGWPRWYGQTLDQKS